LSDWNNSEAVDGPAEDLVRRLREQPGGDIGVHGSIEVAQSLLNARLVDELQLVVSPAFGFPGRRLFDAAKEVQSLELLSAKASPSGSLMLAYRVR
jgi:dihydrofolate reductase